MKYFIIGVGAIGASLGIGYAFWRLHHSGYGVAKNRTVAYLYHVPAICAAPIRAITSRIRNKTLQDIFDPIDVISDYGELEMRSSDNGHPISGAVRDTAHRAIRQKILASGCLEYDLSPGQHDHGHYRHLEHVVLNDLHSKERNDYIPKDCIMMGVDIDYYIEDLNKLLVLQRPIVFYTFNPIEVSGQEGEVSFRIANDRVHYQVSGGGTWNHLVWNWRADVDFIAGFGPIQHWSDFLTYPLGFVRVTTFKKIVVQPWQHFPNRVVVWLLPHSTYLTNRYFDNLDYHVVQRVKYQDKDRPGWNSIVSTVIDEDGKFYPQFSVGRDGAHQSILMRKTDADLLMGMSTATGVNTKMNQFGYSGHQISLFSQYYSKSLTGMGEKLEFGRVATPTVVTFYPDNCLGEPDSVNWRAIGPNLVEDHSLVPMVKRFEAFEKTLDYRVTSRINKKVPSDDRVAKWIEEFIENIIPAETDGGAPMAGTGVPYSFEETYELLQKPSQHQAIDRILETIDVEAKQSLKTGFMKDEPTQKPSRLITAFDDARFLVGFSSFTLRMRDEVLHHVPPFCPGLSPLDIVARVRDYLCNYVSVPCIGDYSNFDGTVSAYLQRAVNTLYLRYFQPKYRRVLNRFLESLVSGDCKSKRFGYAYEGGPGIKSGAPTTCDMNTVIGMLVMYIGIRYTYSRDVRMHVTPKRCFSQIGLCFGDDALFDQKFRNGWEWATRQFGLELKTGPFNAEDGVDFLGRIYADFENCDTTFQDPLRTLRKLNLTSRNKNIPLADAALDRVEGYLMTDSLTPIISAYCRLVLRSYDDSGVRHLRVDRKIDRPYWAYGGEGAMWPQEPQDLELIMQKFAHRVGLAPTVVKQYHQYLEGLTHVSMVKPIWRGGIVWPYEGLVLPDGERNVWTINKTSNEPSTSHITTENADIKRSNSTSAIEDAACPSVGNDGCRRGAVDSLSGKGFEVLSAVSRVKPHHDNAIGHDPLTKSIHGGRSAETGHNSDRQSAAIELSGRIGAAHGFRVPRRWVNSKGSRSGDGGGMVEKSSKTSGLGGPRANGDVSHTPVHGNDGRSGAQTATPRGEGASTGFPETGSGSKITKARRGGRKGPPSDHSRAAKTTGVKEFQRSPDHF